MFKLKFLLWIPLVCFLLIGGIGTYKFNSAVSKTLDILLMIAENQEIYAKGIRNNQDRIKVIEDRLGIE